MRPDAEEMARLWDMLDAARTAVEFTKGVGFEDFLAHPVFAYFRMDSRQRPGTLSPDPWHFALSASSMVWERGDVTANDGIAHATGRLPSRNAGSRPGAGCLSAERVPKRGTWRLGSRPTLRRNAHRVLAASISGNSR